MKKPKIVILCQGLKLSFFTLCFIVLFIYFYFLFYFSVSLCYRLVTTPRWSLFSQRDRPHRSETVVIKRDEWLLFSFLLWWVILRYVSTCFAWEIENRCKDLLKRVKIHGNKVCRENIVFVKFNPFQVKTWYDYLFFFTAWTLLCKDLVISGIVLQASKLFFGCWLWMISHCFSIVEVGALGRHIQD